MDQVDYNSSYSSKTQFYTSTFFQMDIFDAAERYKEEKRSLIILAGKEYGCGSSRDWAAKGPWMQVCETNNVLFCFQFLRYSRLYRYFELSQNRVYYTLLYAW